MCGRNTGGRVWASSAGDRMLGRQDSSIRILSEAPTAVACITGAGCNPRKCAVALQKCPVQGTPGTDMLAPDSFLSPIRRLKRNVLHPGAIPLREYMLNR